MTSIKFFYDGIVDETTKSSMKRIFSILKDFSKKNWPWVLSIAVIFIGTIIFLVYENIEERGQIGDFFAGISATLAFIWLIAGFYLQREELKLQRQELSAQRDSLNLQKEELKKIGKYSSLTQINKILKNYEENLKKLNIPGVSSVSELSSNLFQGMSLWKGILDINDNHEVFKNYQDWMKLEGASIGLLRSLVMVINIYQEATNTLDLLPHKDPIWFIYLNSKKLREIPFISNYLPQGDLIANFLIKTEPGRKRVELKGLETQNNLFPGIVNIEALENLRREVAELKKNQ